MNRNSQNRFTEIDFLRGTAIVMMVIYHLFYDLHYFNAYNINIESGLLWYFSRAIAVIFIVLAGVSLSISYSRTTLNKENTREKEIFLKYFKRGIKIFSLGLLITFATWIFMGEGFIIFGILHFIGLSIILAYPFIKHRFMNLFLGIFFIFFGIYLGNFTFDFNWLMWLGFIPHDLYTVDYFPVLPWFGVILIGIFLGNMLYPKNTRKYKFLSLPNIYLTKFFCFLGKHSLLIYLIHQPIIITILYFSGIINIGFL